VINNIVSIAVFGSIKKGKERPTSDIDLLVLVRNSEDKRKVEENFGTVNEKVIGKFGNTISTYIQTTEEFKTKYKKGLALVKNIFKSHKLLFGKPLEDLL
jgi:predicted nucleotidyltransferase